MDERTNKCPFNTVEKTSSGRISVVELIHLFAFAFVLIFREVLSCRKAIWGVLTVDLLQVSARLRGSGCTALYRWCWGSLGGDEVRRPPWKRSPAGGGHAASHLPTGVIIHSSADTRDTRQRTGQWPWQMGASLPSSGTQLCLVTVAQPQTHKRPFADLHVVWAVPLFAGCLLCTKTGSQSLYQLGSMPTSPCQIGTNLPPNKRRNVPAGFTRRRSAAQHSSSSNSTPVRLWLLNKQLGKECASIKRGETTPPPPPPPRTPRPLI